MITRRSAVVGILFVLAGGVAGPALARPKRRPPPPKKRRKVRRRVRRRIRRRHRRRVIRRTVRGRPMWVVPVGLAVGWELLRDDKVVVVKEVKIVEVEAEPREIVVVVHTDGTEEEIEVVREDDENNAVELEGSVLNEGDEKTPGVESEIEVEEEVEVED